ncbi:glycosyltransferase family 9 protein [Shewanella algidipiscicola]|uniref:glycosyltransferase family 9 protein n=1 Tax=Shewanella algidipiscicola TaxID=614070 RepID=UPI000D78A028|nr:glycosyltransferase family 9 protein [Shewanella algidipiscicola]
MAALINHSTLQGAKRLLYMTHLAIGDFVYQGVWLRALKAKYPHLTIDIWFDDCRTKPHDWATGRNKILGEWIDAIGDFNETYPIVSNLDERQAAIKRAQGKQYDTIVFIGKNRPEQFAKIARQISPTATIVASKSGSLLGTIKGHQYFKKLDATFNYDKLASNSQHVTDLYRQCFNIALGLEAKDLLDGKTQLSIDIKPQYRDSVKPLITALTDNDADKLVVFINHLSTATKKDYPWEQVKALLLQLNHQFNNLVFVINTPPDQLRAVEEAISQDVVLKPLPILTFTALNNFFELPALIGLCDIVISVDTATAHLAVCMGKPQVTIMASDFKLWQPLGDSLVLEGKGKAKSVTPEQVCKAFSCQVEAHFNGTGKYQPR